MLHSYSNPTIALTHPHMKFSSFKMNWKAKISLPVKPISRLQSGWHRDHSVHLYVRSLSLRRRRRRHWCLRSTYTQSKQTDSLFPRFRPCFSLLFLYCGCSSFAMTWLDSALKLALRTKREHSAYLFKKHHGNNAVSLSLWRRRRSNSPPVPLLPPTSFLSSLEYWSGINSLVYLPSPVLLRIRSY